MPVYIYLIVTQVCMIHCKKAFSCQWLYGKKKCKPMSLLRICWRWLQKLLPKSLWQEMSKWRQCTWRFVYLLNRNWLVINLTLKRCSETCYIWLQCCWLLILNQIQMQGFTWFAPCLCCVTQYETSITNIVLSSWTVGWEIKCLFCLVKA